MLKLIKDTDDLRLKRMVTKEELQQLRLWAKWLQEINNFNKVA